MIYFFKHKTKGLRFWTYATGINYARMKALKAMGDKPENVEFIRRMDLNEFSLAVQGGQFFEV